MAKVTFFSFLGLLALALGNPLRKPFYPKLNNRIVGGLTVEKGQFPHQVSLQDTYGHFCGGSILNKKWILTAAHCTTNFFAVFGVTNMTNAESEGTKHTVRRVIMHPDYHYLHNEISLIQLNDAITFSDKVKNIGLPNVDMNIKDLPVNVSGWGVSLGGKISEVLQYLPSKIYDRESCVKVVNGVIKTNLCIFTKEGEYLCFGDSGGPVVAGDVQVGIVSWGEPCTKGYPDVNTDVSSYLDWIKS